MQICWEIWDSTWALQVGQMPRFELLSRDALPAAGADLAWLAHHSALPILQRIVALNVGTKIGQLSNLKAWHPQDFVLERFRGACLTVTAASILLAFGKSKNPRIE